MAHARVKQEGVHVLLEMMSASMPAQSARELARALLHASLAARDYERDNHIFVTLHPLTGRLRVAQQKALVLIQASSGLMTHWLAAQMGKALLEAAMLADEYANAERIAFDSALLLRAGIPIGFTSHPKILEEARKEAESNRDLRRYLPGGIKSKEQMGRPTVFNVPGTSPAEIAAVKAAREIA